MFEYDPDTQKPNDTENSGSGDPFANAIKVPIDDRRPFSEANPKYKERYEAHKKMGILFMLCPECKCMGLHRQTGLTQVTPGVMHTGDFCDICGYEDSEEFGG